MQNGCRCAGQCDALTGFPSSCLQSAFLLFRSTSMFRFSSRSAAGSLGPVDTAAALSATKVEHVDGLPRPGRVRREHPRAAPPSTRPTMTAKPARSVPNTAATVHAQAVQAVRVATQPGKSKSLTFPRRNLASFLAKNAA